MRVIKRLAVVTPKLETKFREWAADKRGVAAVEFALIAIPFFFILMAIFEVAILFAVSTALENGISEASRAIRTGEFQNSGGSESTFRAAVCSELLGLLPCDANLYIDVRTFDSFGNSSDNSPIDPDTQDLNSDDFQFNPGGRDQVVVARVFYEWELLTPGLTAPLANLSGNKRLLRSTTAFR
ncbi:MAG: TadE/TadG family type IV pilus assembly protein, partial [Cyanobacteria bacterium J06642_2]